MMPTFHHPVRVHFAVGLISSWCCNHDFLRRSATYLASGGVLTISKLASANLNTWV